MGFNGFEDVWPDFQLTLPISYQDRIDAVPFDQQYCTVANAVVRIGHGLGITALGQRGVKKTVIDLFLDPQAFPRHPWPNNRSRRVEPYANYRAQLTRPSTKVVMELDLWIDRPKSLHDAYKQVLRREAATFPDGTDHLWATVDIVAPFRPKGYRSGSSGTSRNRKSAGPVASGPNRRYVGFPRQVVVPPTKP
jgi:hypothetical protein